MREGRIVATRDGIDKQVEAKQGCCLRRSSIRSNKKKNGLKSVRREC